MAKARDRIWGIEENMKAFVKEFEFWLRASVYVNL